MKFTTVNKVVQINSAKIIFAPFLNINLRWISVNKHKVIKGINPGYRIKLSQKSSLINFKKDRWKPHPGHSYPVASFI